MQQGRALDTSEPRGMEVDEESKSSISTSSSPAGIPLDSPGDVGHYRDDETVTYEIDEHFLGATELDSRRGYVRDVGQIEAGSSSGTARQGVAEGTHGHYRAYVGQQGAMYGQHGGYSYDPNWVPHSPILLLSIKHILIEQGMLPLPPFPRRPFHAPHTYFMPTTSHLNL
ncbi:hypothetical protein AAC387_Pa02g2876 [Persea americana]